MAGRRTREWKVWRLLPTEGCSSGSCRRHSPRRRRTRAKEPVRVNGKDDLGLASRPAAKDKLHHDFFDYNSRRPSRAFAIVTWSAYSKSPPTGRPSARRVTRIPNGLIRRDKYSAVVSPSTFGLVAMITSSTLPV